MAESGPQKDDLDELSDEIRSVKLSGASEIDPGPNSGSSVNRNLCCICQEPCVNPVRLPCSHVFCYLCIKGVAARNNHCALCRHRINRQVVDNPSVVNRAEIQSSIKKSSESQGWYYEAKNGGWWLYEQRTSAEIEKAYKDNQKQLRLQISGFYYIIDFENMIQYREEMPNRRRQIKRDMISEDIVKGVAGIVVTEKSDWNGNGAGDESASSGSTEDYHDPTTSVPSDIHQESEPPENQSRLVTGHD